MELLGPPPRTLLEHAPRASIFFDTGEGLPAVSRAASATHASILAWQKGTGALVVLHVRLCTGVSPTSTPEATPAAAALVPCHPARSHLAPAAAPEQPRQGAPPLL